MYIKITFDDDDLKRLVKNLKDSGNEKKVLSSIGEALIPINIDRHRREVNPNEKPWAKLSKLTLATKRKRFMLRESGEMLSIHYQVFGDVLKIGSSDWKAAWHHFGTKKYQIKPKNKKALAFGRKIGSGKKEFVRKYVNHPGLTAREIVGFEKLDREAAENAIIDFYKSVVNNI